MPNKIAFLFLIYDKINHEDVWNEFFKDNKGQYSVYIHYKTKHQSKYFESCKLKKCIPTAWGTLSLVRAQNLLIEEALRDPDNKMFVFCSGACVPVKTFDYFYQTIDEKYSYFNFYPDHESFPRCDVALKYINKEFVQKSSQWCILNRKHAQMLIEYCEYLKWFEGTIGDEHCYISYLNYRKSDSELVKIPAYKKPEDATTFVNWHNWKYAFRDNDNSYGYLANCHPKTYKYIRVEELNHLFKSKCFFARKFAPECNLSGLKFLLMSEKRKKGQNQSQNNSHKNVIVPQSNSVHLQGQYV